MLAALNHPNIAQIYGVEERALVMELVEGENLKGPLPVETALAYAKQIADALEAAHEKGIVHRDLKPANVKVTPEGVVKVLDFGLAKAAEERPVDAQNSPTMTMSPTRAGMILGTAAYMSPEQARGKAVDKRADIWAFGCVLYEMLTGRPAFTGETITDVLAAVVKSEPDWNAVPLKVRRLLASCYAEGPEAAAASYWRLSIAAGRAAAGWEPAPQPARLGSSGGVGGGIAIIAGARLVARDAASGSSAHATGRRSRTGRDRWSVHYCRDFTRWSAAGISRQESGRQANAGHAIAGRDQAGIAFGNRERKRPVLFA